VGEARVVGIAPCPPVEGDPASPAGVITGLFRHESGEVVDVHITGLDEPIGTTANHPFWSEDAQAFVPASELGVGEQVRTLAGLAHVTVVTARGPPEAVYNLEVHGEHVYQVTSLGVLVHNRCPNPFGRRGSPAHVAKINEAEAMLNARGWQTVAGGSRPEMRIGNRFPDLIVERNGQRIAVQVGKRTRAGLPIARERRALADLRAAMDPTTKLPEFIHAFFVQY
jgi:hypothetical protein